MTLPELQANINFLFVEGAELGIELYFLLKDEDAMEIRFADIDDPVATDLKEKFIASVRRKLIDDEDVDYGVISTVEETKSSICYYDLEDEPDELSFLFDVHDSDDYEDFSFSDDDLTKIQGFIIKLGNEENHITLFKKNYPVSLVKRALVYGFYPAQTRIVKLDANIIKLNDAIEFMIVNDELIVLDTKVFEKHFGFDKIIFHKAGQQLVRITNSNILENVEVLQQLSTDLKYAKKLMKIKDDSPVLQLEFPNIRTFIEGHPNLRRRIRFNEGNTRIRLDTKVSKELFIKLLNDDFLISQLTSMYYDSLNKRPMGADGVEQEA